MELPDLITCTLQKAYHQRTRDSLEYGLWIRTVANVGKTLFEKTVAYSTNATVAVRFTDVSFNSCGISMSSWSFRPEASQTNCSFDVNFPRSVVVAGTLTRGYSRM